MSASRPGTLSSGGGRGAAAGVDDEPPAALIQRPRERKAEPTRRSRDDSNGHGTHDASSSPLEVKGVDHRPLTNDPAPRADDQSRTNAGGKVMKSVSRIVALAVVAVLVAAPASSV